MQTSRYAPLNVASRYLVRQFLGVLVPVTITFILLYVIVDLFDRLGILLRHQASVGAAARYFAFKIPLMLSQVMPAAVITAVLLSLGLLSRYNEITAFRAGGVSLVQTAIPILVTAGVISLLSLLWNETVVPYSSRQFQYVNNVEIRRRQLRGILSERQVWFHGENGFYNIDHVDKASGTIYGLAIYELTDDFELRSVVEIPRAQWADGQWQFSGAVRRQIENSRFSVTPLGPDEFRIPETFDDFLEVQREPEELSFLVLREWIAQLTRKGIDASEYLVDLHSKLALPFASAVLALVGIPISARARRNPSIAAILGTGLAVGFLYWVILGLAQSLGRSGVLPALVAAWAANGFFVLLGLALFLYSE